MYLRVSDASKYWHQTIALVSLDKTQMSDGANGPGLKLAWSRRITIWCSGRLVIGHVVQMKRVHFWKSYIFAKDGTIAFRCFGHVLRSSASIESRIPTTTGRLLIWAESLRDLVIFDLGWSYHHWWNKLNFYYRRDESIESHESQNITSVVLKKRQSRLPNPSRE